MCADRCKPHGARACRRCETPGEHLDAGKLEQLRRAYDNENWRGWGVTRVVHDLIDALVAERAAHATTKAERDSARRFHTDEWTDRRRLAAKVARIEALADEWEATRGFHKMICAEQLRAALAGDGDD